jgi:hypothetical protein
MLNEPIILGLKFAIRVHDLTRPDVKVVTSPACHKVFTFGPHVLYPTLRPNNLNSSHRTAGQK